jgi:SAM-dependent methyltransferase
MPVERKPLFRAEILAPRAAALALGPEAEQARDVLRKWARLLGSARAEELTESELLPDFLTDIFYKVLGYRGPTASGERYTLSREKHVEVDGKFADAVLGEFGGNGERPLLALEGKGTRDPLDRPFAGRRMSAVDQAYRYAINLPCDWILVTNLREIRLYHKNHDQRTFERFEINALAEHEAAFRQLVFLLGADRIVPATGPGHLEELLKASEQAGLELTRRYYAEFSRIRREILGRLRVANPSVPAELLLFYTQKLLDRVLFVAFAEDRGLLPPETLVRALKHHDPYNPRSKWETFKGLFRAIDQGNGELNIPGYNGGLFAKDPGLDRIEVPDEVCAELKRLGDYDYHSPAATNGDGAGLRLVDVEILGHIFERSITDLERLEQELAAGNFELDRVERRKREGAFYTPRVITRFIVGRALRPVLLDRFEDLRRRHQEGAGKNVVSVLADPRVYDLGTLKKPQKEALLLFWDAWLGELKRVRVLDPACGSGAFLIEAFDQLHTVYQEAADRLYELRGFRTLFDPDQTILEKNLYGVDLNEEAIQICRLSIWIKTAQRGKKLTDLDHTIRAGNSLVDESELDPRNAFDWQAAFPEAFADGGFDVVVGNPPYVRQELLSALKPYFERRFKAYHGVADLYIYFFERGLQILKPGGRLSFVVTNKWLRSGYAEPLRRLLSSEAWLETLVDLGHAKKIFEDADVFPSIVVLAKPRPDALAPAPRVAVIARDDVRLDDLDRQVDEEGFELPRERLGSAPWTPEPDAVRALMAKIRSQGTPLAEYARLKPYYGIKTGLNEAFLVDSETRDRLVAEDPRADEILKSYLRGQDVRRWRAQANGLWMILLKSSDDHGWPWSFCEPRDAESTFAATYPSLHQHLVQWKDELIARSDQGRFWWELRRCSYYSEFQKPKVLYQDIVWKSEFALTEGEVYCNNTTYFLPTSDIWLLTVLNSPLIWWYSWRTAQHAKDEALRFFSQFVEALPIAAPRGSHEEEARSITSKLIGATDERARIRSLLSDWLKVEHGVVKPARRLDDLSFSAEDLIEEVRRARGKKSPLSAAALRNLREEHARTIAPLAERLREVGRIEVELSDLVCQAYNLTQEEIDLMWQTAPPRMPIANPLVEPPE